MKRISFLVACTLILSVTANSQAAKSIYAELGGPGFASLNFDTRFTKSESGIGGRIGIGGFNVDGESVLMIPIGINYLLGKDEKNYFEIGGGATIVSTKLMDDEPYTGSFGHLNIGYRLQPKKGGFTFRAAITPIFGSGYFWPYWGGVSFGYKF
ncbi:MAG TPA: hypothetical protein VF145_03430 [Chitinophagaceae bacterium]